MIVHSLFRILPIGDHHAVGTNTWHISSPQFIMHTAWVKYEGQRWQLSPFNVNSFRNVFYQQHDLYRSQDSSVSIVIMFLAGQAGVWFLEGIRNASVFQTICTRCRDHLVSCSVGTGSSLPRSKEAKVWNCTFSPHVCHHGVHRDKFTFCRTTDYIRNIMNWPMLVCVEGDELFELFSSVKCANMAILAIINVAPNA